jgi:hypothetical protein
MWLTGGASAPFSPCSRHAAGPARDDKGPTPSAGRPSAALAPPGATRAPTEGSGANEGVLAQWSQPGGGTSLSSSGITTAAPGPAAAAGTGEVGGVATATAVVATVIGTAGCGSASAAGCCGSASVASCRGSTSVVGCGGSVAAACCASVATGSGSVVVAAGHGSVALAAPCGSPLAATAVLAAAHDALDERSLAGMAASVLSTLVGARGGTVGATLRTRR